MTNAQLCFLVGAVFWNAVFACTNGEDQGVPAVMGCGFWVASGVFMYLSW